MASKNNIDYLKKSLEISTANHDSFGVANNSDLLGDAYVSSGKYEMAIEYLLPSLSSAAHYHYSWHPLVPSLLAELCKVNSHLDLFKIWMFVGKPGGHGGWHIRETRMLN